MLWRRLDVPGHDAAIVMPEGPGRVLRGTSIFTHEEGPACLAYAVTLDTGWRSLGGTIIGFVGTRQVDHVILREPDGWSIDGRRVDGLGHLVDLDYSFTPATNFQQLQRVRIGVGDAAEIPALWYDLESDALTELPQSYERISESRYRYVAPSVAFETILDIAPNGFASLYPPLWEAEPSILPERGRP